MKLKGAEEYSVLVRDVQTGDVAVLVDQRHVLLLAAHGLTEDSRERETGVPGTGKYHIEIKIEIISRYQSEHHS